MKLMSNGSNDLVKVSSKEFSTLAGIEYAAAQGFIKFLVAQGLATVAEKRPNPTGKGRATTVYNVPAQIALNFDNTEEVSAPVETPAPQVEAAPQVTSEVTQPVQETVEATAEVTPEAVETSQAA